MNSIPQFRTDDVPLSAVQQRLWLLEQLAPASPAHHLSQAFRLGGELSQSALRASLTEILRRHETLRTTFHNDGGQPIARVSPPSNFDLSFVDLRHITETEREKELRRLTLAAVRQPFDLTRDPMLRATLAQVGEKCHVLLLTAHRLAVDAESMNILARELGTFYDDFLARRPASMPEPCAAYREFAARQRDWLASAEAEKQLGFWKQHLEGTPALLEFPMGRPRPAAPTLRGGRHRIVVDTVSLEALRALGRKEGWGLSTLLLAAFQVLAFRYSGRADIVLGLLVDCRAPEESGAVGNFTNTLVLRAKVAGDAPFREFVAASRAALASAQAHARFPFEKLLEAMNPPRDESYHPLFQAQFLFSNVSVAALQEAGLSIRPIELDSQVIPIDLTLRLADTKGGVEGWIEYATDLFEPQAVARMAGHFETLLRGILENPDQRIALLPLLTPEERQQVLVEWNDTGTRFPGNECLHQLVESQAARSPEAIALIFGQERLTYRELNRRANRLAHYLLGLGVGPEALVGICLERSIEMVIALLAVLKTGAAYVPMDPAYPADRLAFIMQDAGAPVLLTQQSLIARLPSHRAKVVLLDQPSLWNVAAPHRGRNRSAVRAPAELEKNPSTAVTPNNLAYVIYTSGSTGQPKGVAIEHHSPVTLVRWALQTFSQEELAGVLASTSICFDLSIFEIFVPLSAGGKIILAENALQLPELPFAWQVTLVNTVPSAMGELVRSGSIPPSVITVNLAGEPLETALVNQIYESGSVTKVYDLYGPSEDTTYSTFTLRKREGPATIGRPIANTRVYLLDEHHQPVPIGLPGELHLAGDGLARGYLNQPALTAEKFIPNPFEAQPGSRLYKTGDLARYFADGNLEFLGRKDNQVKIRGFRIELGEIEHVLKQHHSIDSAVVVAREEAHIGKRLVAYLVWAPPPSRGGPSARAATSEGPSVFHADELREQSLLAELRAWLKTKLPEYMVPAALVPLPSLPLTPNGKVDRKALPPPEQFQSASKEPLAGPRTPTEELLAEIWCEVLKLPEVGIRDNFFELGGHSLMATQVISRLRETAQVELTMRHFFDTPTIAALAGVIEAILLEEISQLSDEQAQWLAAGGAITANE